MLQNTGNLTFKDSFDFQNNLKVPKTAYKKMDTRLCVQDTTYILNIGFPFFYKRYDVFRIIQDFIDINSNCKDLSFSKEDAKNFISREFGDYKKESDTSYSKDGISIKYLQGSIQASVQNKTIKLYVEIDKNFSSVQKKLIENLYSFKKEGYV